MLHPLNSSTNRGTLATLTLALTASLVLASSASAASAGEEYLPKLPSAGASSAGSEYFPDKTALRAGFSNDSRRTTGSHTLRAANSPQQAPGADNPAKKRKVSKRLEAAALASDQNGGGGGGGGDGSGSILLSPLVLLMIGAVIAAAVGMTLSRNRRDDSEWEGERRRQGPRRETTGPRTPEGEILARPDQST